MKKVLMTMEQEYNMNKFNTPEEAITACNKELERAWIEYSSIRQFDSLSTGALKYAFKEVFTAGYMSGASFISSVVVAKIQPKNNDTTTASTTASSIV